jgi:hypothetical protein
LESGRSEVANGAIDPALSFRPAQASAFAVVRHAAILSAVGSSRRKGFAKQWGFIAVARAETNGAITLQLRSQKATTLSPVTFLCPLTVTLH